MSLTRTRIGKLVSYEVFHIKKTKPQSDEHFVLLVVESVGSGKKIRLVWQYKCSHGCEWVSRIKDGLWQFMFELKSIDLVISWNFTTQSAYRLISIIKIESRNETVATPKIQINS